MVVLFAELGKWNEARRDFEQALKLNPRDEGALYGLSQALREAKEYGGAQSALSDLISRSGNFVYWLEWGRIVMIRYWWVLLLIAIGWALKGKLQGQVHESEDASEWLRQKSAKVPPYWR